MYQDDITGVSQPKSLTNQRVLNQARFAPREVVVRKSGIALDMGSQHVLMVEVYHGSLTRRKARLQSEPK